MPRHGFSAKGAHIHMRQPRIRSTSSLSQASELSKSSYTPDPQASFVPAPYIHSLLSNKPKIRSRLSTPVHCAPQSTIMPLALGKHHVMSESIHRSHTAAEWALVRITSWRKLYLVNAPSDTAILETHHLRVALPRPLQS